MTDKPDWLGDVEVVGNEETEMKGASVETYRIRTGLSSEVAARSRARIWARFNTPKRTPSMFTLTGYENVEGGSEITVIIAKGDENRIQKIKDALNV